MEVVVSMVAKMMRISKNERVKKTKTKQGGTIRITGV